MPIFLVRYERKYKENCFPVVHKVTAETVEDAFEEICDQIAVELESGVIDPSTIKVFETVEYKTIPKIDIKDFKKQKD